MVNQGGGEGMFSVAFIHVCVCVCMCTCTCGVHACVRVKEVFFKRVCENASVILLLKICGKHCHLESLAEAAHVLSDGV